MNVDDKFEHHSRFYLPDGDVVLQPDASRDGKTTLYRIHKGVLSFNSLFFQTMFGLPNSENAGDHYDDAPIIRVHDSAEDFGDLLRALYDPGCASAVCEP